MCVYSVILYKDGDVWVVSLKREMFFIYFYFLSLEHFYF